MSLTFLKSKTLVVLSLLAGQLTQLPCPGRLLTEHSTFQHMLIFQRCIPECSGAHPLHSRKPSSITTLARERRNNCLTVLCRSAALLGTLLKGPVCLGPVGELLPSAAGLSFCVLLISEDSSKEADTCT